MMQHANRLPLLTNHLIHFANEGNALGSIISHGGQVIVAKADPEGHGLLTHPGSNIILQPTSLSLDNIDTDGDKKAIYRHPLFPLMALLLEKCELAAQTPDGATADSFDVDIHAFVQQQEQEQKPFLSDDPELDNLMLKSIQVLRIHLLELEKVTDLCQDFCNRYISCLKGKLQSDSLLRVDTMFDESDLPVGCGPVPVGGAASSQASGLSMAMTMNQGQLVSGGTVYQMVQTPQGIVAQPIQIQTLQQQQQSQSQVQVQPPYQAQVTCASIIHGSTPLSQIGIPSSPVPSLVQTNQQTLCSTLPSNDDHDDDGGGQSSKRGVLPKQATAIMKSWLFQHIVHPYPTEDEKRQIALQTNLSLLQVNNWFINARRRILQPMLDSSDPTQPSKSKKSKPQTRPMQRFWPESIANLQPQTGADDGLVHKHGNDRMYDLRQPDDRTTSYVLDGPSPHQLHSSGANSPSDHGQSSSVDDD